MFIVIAIAVFVVVALGVFVIASLLDERSSKARLLRERLTNVQKTPEREAGESLALLRDEVLSKIPALDSLLRRSNRIASLQTLLEQADLKSRPGNVVLLGLVSGVALGLLVLLFGFGQFAWVGALFGMFLPYSYANYKRNKRFQKFEELFPEAIDTLARAVRAGHAFTTALELIANELGDPVASEFQAFRRAEIRYAGTRRTDQSHGTRAPGGREILCHGGHAAARDRR